LFFNLFRKAKIFQFESVFCSIRLTLIVVLFIVLSSDGLSWLH